MGLKNFKTNSYRVGGDATLPQQKVLMMQHLTEKQETRLKNYLVSVQFVMEKNQ